MENGDGSEGSRDERKSREEGCGGDVFTGRRLRAHCGFVCQQLKVCELPLQTNNQAIFTPLWTISPLLRKCNILAREYRNNKNNSSFISGLAVGFL